MTQSKLVHVAVGVLLNDKEEVLVALRPHDVHQGGLWEFPGGKLEAGESVEHALAREFEEEIGITVRASTPFMQIRHDYGDKSVLLDIWKIADFSGSPSGREGQEVRWRKIAALQAGDFPAANAGIIRALSLPSRIAITPQVDDRGAMQDTIRRLLGLGAKLIYFPQKTLDLATYLDWFAWADKLCVASGAKLMYCHPNSAAIEPSALERLQALHADSRQLLALNSRPTGAEQLFSATCRNLEELLHAQALDADFAFLSPVSSAPEYQDSPLLGWAGFRELAGQVNLPVFALGGMRPEDLSTARAHQGFGIAGKSVFTAARVPSIGQ